MYSKILYRVVVNFPLDNQNYFSSVNSISNTTSNMSPSARFWRAIIIFLSTVVMTQFLSFSVIAETQTAVLKQGKQVFNQSCVFCHQADAIGKPGFAPSLANKEFLSIAPKKFLIDTITEGRPGTGMPPFKYLGEKKIHDVVAYLRSLATLPFRVKAVAKQKKAKGNWRKGKDQFNRICLGCHGPKGNGYSAGGTGTAIGKAGFLDKVSDGFIRTTIKEGRSGTRMLSFQGPQALADLSNKEIDDIISYLRTVPSK